MHTEAEAREKWCPEARWAEDAMPGANRWGGHTRPPECRCIASNCMAWRWVRPSGLAPASHGLAPASRRIEEPTPTQGYCGAFGKPGDA